MDENTLIERLKQQISTGRAPSEEYNLVRQQAKPPVMLADFIEAKARLGFPLPPLLKRLYTEVGNGGFGPGYGLFELTRDPSVDHPYIALVDTYLEDHPAPSETAVHDAIKEGFEVDLSVCYPAQVLMACHWGCSIYSFIDCSSPEYRVLRQDYNCSLTDYVFECPSFQQWLEAWLDGVPLFKSCYREPWEQAPKVLFSPSRD